MAEKEIRESITEKLDGFLNALPGKHAELLILGHNLPDPDCLAAAIGIETLLSFYGRSGTIAFGGGLGRAENRAMAGLLEIDYADAETLNFSDFSAAIIVDTQPGAGNINLPKGFPVAAVFDHHIPPDSGVEAAWTEIKTEYGSTCSIVYEYLTAAEVDIDERLATALFLGIRTDTENLERDGCPADTEAYVSLLPKVNKQDMLRVLRPALGEEYFGLLRRALNQCRRWDNLVVSNVGNIHAPDLLSEVAQLFLRLKGVEFSVAIGVYEGDVFFSIRAERSVKNTLDIVRDIMGPHGTAGGHGRAAGGRINCEPDTAQAEAKQLRERLVDDLGVRGGGPRPVCLDAE